MAVPVTVSALTNTVKVVRLSEPAGVWSMTVANPSAAIAYVQCFDALKPADVTLGTTVATWVVPVTTAQTITVAPTQPISFLKGLQIAATTTATGSTAPATALDVALVL